MDNYYFQKTRFPGIWELGSLDPIKIEETHYMGHCKLRGSDRRVRKLMDFLGLKYRARNIINPQNMSKIGWHIDFENDIVGNPKPTYLKKWPWMIIMVASNSRETEGTRIRRTAYATGHLESWKIYLTHRCVMHDSPEKETKYTRFLNRYDIHSFPEPKCMHNYRRKLRKKHIAIAQALLKD